MADVITHPDIAKFCIIRQDYVAIANGNYCAAMLLSIFEGYNNWLGKHKRALWIDLSGDELSQAMCGLYSRKAIMTAGVQLERLGLVRRKHKSSCDRTYQYLLIPEAVQQRLNLATFWDATLKLAFWRVRGAVWFKAGIQWLKSLWKAIIPLEPMQGIHDTYAAAQTDLCSDTNQPAFINISRDSSNHSSLNGGEPGGGEEKNVDKPGPQTIPLAKLAVQPETTVEKQIDLVQDTYIPAQPLISEIKETHDSITLTMTRLLPRVVALGISDTPGVRALLVSVPLAQAEMNLLALEEESAANGLKSPTGALEAAIRYNWQAKQSPHEAWWQAAGLYWGKERRNALIQALTKWNGRVVAILANGEQIAFENLGSLSWDSVENLAKS